MMQSIPLTYQPVGTLRSTWMIAARQIRETLFSRRSLYTLGFSLAFVFFEINTVLKPVLSQTGSQIEKGTLIAVWLSSPVLLNATTTILTAVNAFAGEKERGSLLPLLATPASNLAIFAGKILGSIIPAILYALIGSICYFALLSITYGTSLLSTVPWVLAVQVVVLALGMMLLSSVLASIISSRAQKFQTAQSVSSTISTIILIGVLFGSIHLNEWGVWAYPAADAGLILLDIVLVIIAAATWKREEVMARL